MARCRVGESPLHFGGHNIGRVTPAVYPAPRGAVDHNTVVPSEGNDMRAYELMVIIDIDLDDSKAQGWIKTVTEAIGAAGGSIHGRPHWWGRTQFAYPIDHKTAGYYFVIECLAPAGSLDELERSLRIADDVVRHKLIRLPDAEAERRGMIGQSA